MRAADVCVSSKKSSTTTSVNDENDDRRLFLHTWTAGLEGGKFQEMQAVTGKYRESEVGGSCHTPLMTRTCRFSAALKIKVTTKKSQKCKMSTNLTQLQKSDTSTMQQLSFFIWYCLAVQSWVNCDQLLMGYFLVLLLSSCSSQTICQKLNKKKKKSIIHVTMVNVVLQE